MGNLDERTSLKRSANANKYMKKYSILLAMREMQIITHWDYILLNKK